jgi:hypothetical protein
MKILFLIIVSFSLIGEFAFAAEQGIADATAGAVGKSIGLIVPVLVKIITSFIPIILVAHLVIMKIRYWRVDNREDGGEPFSKKEIREKVYHVGKWWGMIAQTLFQPVIFLLMGFKIEVGITFENFVYIVTSLAMIGVAWFFTGWFSRLSFDAWMIRTATRAGKSDRMRRWHKWLLVEHYEKELDSKAGLEP